MQQWVGVFFGHVIAIGKRPHLAASRAGGLSVKRQPPLVNRVAFGHIRR
jgi:hypothetical protein